MKRLLILLLVLAVGCGPARTVTIDITEEMMCMTQFLTNVSEECHTPGGCESKCMDEACASYDMDFIGYTYENEHCKCICRAVNKVSKVASYYDTST